MFGEARYNIIVQEQDIQRVRAQRVWACSKNPVKFALNALELLISPDECKNNMTVYGEGKGRTAMDENKRKALRSHSDLYEYYKNVVIWPMITPD